ncbi:MAG: hypothetical protein ABW328_15185 [Ilumatobacteraceae bacterium]
MTLADHWHELVTASLLGTDRRDPPAAPVGPLADVVRDTVVPTSSARMLTAVGACVAARRAGMQPLAPVSALGHPAPDDRPMLRVAAATRWRTVVDEWPVLEDEWLLEVERGGWRLSPDVLVGLLRRHRTDAVRRARVARIGGPVVSWLIAVQPQLAPPAGARVAPGVDLGLPGLAVPPELLALLDAPGEAFGGAVLAGFTSGAFGRAHRAVLVNAIARCRADALASLAASLGASDVPDEALGVARSLADLAACRQAMLEELMP